MAVTRPPARRVYRDAGASPRRRFCPGAPAARWLDRSRSRSSPRTVSSRDAGAWPGPRGLPLPPAALSGRGAGVCGAASGSVCRGAGAWRARAPPASPAPETAASRGAASSSGRCPPPPPPPPRVYRDAVSSGGQMPRPRSRRRRVYRGAVACPGAVSSPASPCALLERDRGVKHAPELLQLWEHV